MLNRGVVKLTPISLRATLTAACLLALIGASAAFAAEGVAPVNTVAPKITGNPRVGQTLSTSQGEWQGSPTSFFYQWLRCGRGGGACASVPGAVGPNYQLTAGDLGSRIRVEVTAVNSDGASPAQRSDATAPVRIAAPTSTARPAISGSPREGETLSATTGTWTGSPTSYAYQWKRCAGGKCAPIPGATASSYLLGGADVGAAMRVRVTAINDGGRRSAQSRSTATVRSATAGFKLGAPQARSKARPGAVPGHGPVGRGSDPRPHRRRSSRSPRGLRRADAEADREAARAGAADAFTVGARRG